MEHANSKMLGRIAEIENCVLSGFVLDDRGNWVSIADKRTSEEDFLVHLEAGRVLHGGHWVNFANAKKAPAYQQTEVSATSTPVASPPVPGADPKEETDSGLYPPETKAIQIQFPVSEREETVSDPSSDYAPETGLFVLEQSQEPDVVLPRHQEVKKNSAETAPEEDRETRNLPALAPPSIPSWEKEESHHKKRTLIITGVIVVVTGIAAIVAIMLQVFH